MRIVKQLLLIIVILTFAIWLTTTILGISWRGHYLKFVQQGIEPACRLIKKISFKSLLYSNWKMYLERYYIVALLIFSYIGGALAWILWDLFKPGDVIQISDRIPKGGKYAWLAKTLFSPLVLAGFVVVTYNFIHERVVMALLLPFAIFLLTRSVTSASTYFQEKSSKHAEIVTIALFVLAAAIMRCYDISDYPPGIAIDEEGVAREVGTLIKGGTVFATGMTGGFKVAYAPLVLLQKVLPHCRAAIRSYWIICGILCIPAFYCLARCCLPALIARLATVLLIFSPYHNLYSRVYCGASITLIEILSLYFLVTAITRRSYARIAFSSVGVALLQYDYFAARIMPFILILGIFVALIGKRITIGRALLCVAVASAVIITILIPYYHTPKPPFYNISYIFQPPDTPSNFSGLKSFGEIKEGIRNCLLMFAYPNYACYGFITQANSQVLHPLLLALLFGGVLCSLAIFGVWPAAFMGLWFFVALLPSVLSSRLGNSHRCLMVIPPMHLLIGYGLWMLAMALGIFMRKSMRWAALVIIVGYSSIWGVGYFFSEMWEIDRDHLEVWWQTSQVRATEAAWDLAVRNYQVSTSNPIALWNYFYDNDKLELGQLAFRTSDWLPENWSHTKKAIVLYDLADGPLFTFLTKWALPYRWTEKYYKIGGTRLLIGTFDGHARQGADLMPTSHMESKGAYQQWDGSIMFAKQYEFKLMDASDGATIYMDGKKMLPLATTVLFASGLHEVCIRAPLAGETTPGDTEPLFDFKVVDVAANKRGTMCISPSMLYSIPVHGWVHTARSDDAALQRACFGIEPVIFKYTLSGEECFPRPGKVIHEWESQACIRRGDILSLELGWGQRGDSNVEVFIDGEPISGKSSGQTLAFQLKGTGKEQTVLIRWHIADEGQYIMLKQTGPDIAQCPPYEAFYPLRIHRFRMAEKRKSGPHKYMRGFYNLLSRDRPPGSR